MMGGEQFMSWCWGVDSDFTLPFTDDERREIEAIAGADLASRVFEELRALAWHAQLRRDMTSENDEIQSKRVKFSRVAKAARWLLDELATEESDDVPAILGFGRMLVTDDVAGEVAIFDEERARTEFVNFVTSIERIESLSESYSGCYGLSTAGSNASDKLKEFVVDGAIEIYIKLMTRDIPASGGNRTGPAARFLFAAANAALRPIARGLPSLDAARLQLARRRPSNDVHN